MAHMQFITPPLKLKPKMVKVKMLNSAWGADDNIHSKKYEQGKEYEISEFLANCFVTNGDADFVGFFANKEKAKLAHTNKAKTEMDYQNKSA